MKYNEAQNRILATACTVALLLCLAILLAQITWDIVESGEVGAVVSNAKPLASKQQIKKANATSPVRLLQQQLQQYNPWHAPVLRSADETLELSEAELSKLDIVLKGTMVLNANTAWAVVLEGSNKKQQVLREGDLIAGAKVEKITRKTLFLRNGDRLEMLAMADDKLESIAGNGNRANAQSSSKPRRSSVHTVSRNDYNELVKKGMGLLKGVSINPYMQGSTSVGYQIKLPSNSVFSEYGLKDQDVVETVNGVPVTESAKLGGLLRNLKQQETLEVEILRNGVPSKVVVNIR